MKIVFVRYFIAIADELSFSKASQRLNVSQSALSRQIQLFENTYGVRLFDRIGRGIELTPAGRDLLHRCRSLLSEVEAVKARAKVLSEGSGGSLRVGATPQTLESVIAGFLLDFRQRFPDVGIELIEGGAAGLAESVEAGNIEVAIAGLTHGSVLAGRKMFPLGVLAIVPKGSAFEGRRSVEATELAAEPLLLLEHQFMTRRIFDGVSQLANMNPRILIESSSPHCLLALVEARLGTAIIPSTVLLGALEDQAIPVTYNGRQLGFDMSVVWDPRRQMSPATSAFIDELCRSTNVNYPGKSFGFTTMDASFYPSG